MWHVHGLVDRNVACTWLIVDRDVAVHGLVDRDVAVHGLVDRDVTCTWLS